MKISKLTENCSAILSVVIENKTEEISLKISAISENLAVSPFDVISLLQRISNPRAEPKFDGHHDAAEWYDNDIQIPRLLVATLAALELKECLPDIIRHHFSMISSEDIDAVVSDAENYIDGYVKNAKRSLFAMGVC